MTQSQKRAAIRTIKYSLVICRNPFSESPDFGKWLTVKETQKRGWWCVGGSLNLGESFPDAARRECREEAGIEIDIKGILKIDHMTLSQDQASLRVIFYAEPTDF